MPISPQNQFNITVCLSCCCWFFCLIQAASDFGSNTISQGQQLRDGEILKSTNKVFTLQFFSLGTSKDRYLGIFLRPLELKDDNKKPVWIANRNNPIDDASGMLTINASYNMLSIVYSGGNIFLPTTLTTQYKKMNTSATLQDDGNLVLRQIYSNGSNGGQTLWQSFDYPTDTLLPGMKLGVNFKTGHVWSLTSWISDRSPLSGSFTLGASRNTSQVSIWWHERVFWTSAEWKNDTAIYDGHLGIISQYTSYENEKYFIYSLTTNGAYRALRMNPDGKAVLEPLNVKISNCDLYSSTVPQTGCANYSLPKCLGVEDNLYNFSTRSYPSNFSSSILEGRNLCLVDCKAKCVQNCSCYGYAPLHENGTGCRFWDKDSIKFMEPSFGNGGSLIYIRKSIAVAETNLEEATKRRRRLTWPWFITSIGGASILILSIFWMKRNSMVKAKRKEAENLVLRRLAEPSAPSRNHMTTEDMLKGKDEKLGKALLFRFETIEMATNMFSIENKLGEGGFGPVYKGKLIDGQEIAVKRLSRSSSQGMVEFKNEIQLIVKLQHNNLVKLLGCCIHQEEMMLVYEYMPNRSLDFLIFDSSKKEVLKWTNRVDIIEGIAQGLLYLHKHSRLRVIHRDLKASNILLDVNMIPKISDFGMAKIFGVQDSEADTKRIVGTHGYMAPEYAIKGIVSTKIDVFSFGVLVLEIVSGKKNNKTYDLGRPLNLIELAWELWADGRALDLVDTTIDVSNHQNEVHRCINIGLLCVQDNATDRPSMTDVIFMLKNEPLKLQTPTKPEFFVKAFMSDKEIEDSKENYCSNKLSVSVMKGR